MDAQISRALIASPFESSRARFSALLRELGVRDMQFSDDGREALKRVSERTIDLLIVDSVLPYLDGATLAEHVLHLKLGVYPGVIMLTDAGMRVRVPEENCVLIDRNAALPALQNVIQRLRPEVRAVSEGNRKRILGLLENVGVPAHYGRDYLLRAIGMTWWDERLAHSLKRRVYPTIAEAYGAGARHVENAIRHSIDLAWKSGRVEAQYESFGDTIDAARGSPSSGEMIARLADILRWEGRA